MGEEDHPETEKNITFSDPFIVPGGKEDENETLIPTRLKGKRGNLK